MFLTDKNIFGQDGILSYVLKKTGSFTRYLRSFNSKHPVKRIKLIKSLGTALVSGQKEIFLLTTAFDGITHIYPGSQAAVDGRRVFEPVFQKEPRHTGARFFGRSGTVSDDLDGGVQFTQYRFHF